MKEFAREFYKSKAWKACRKSFIAYRQGMDGGMCQRCGERAGYIVHHREYITRQNCSDPTVLLCWDNLEYLCKRCHDKEHDYCGRQAQAAIQFDRDGNPLPPISQEK